MVESALEYLKDYMTDPRILVTIDKPEAVMDLVPSWWQRILKKNGADRVRSTLEEWEQHKTVLPSVVEFLSSHLASVNLLINESELLLLYELKRNDEVLYYAGGNPLQTTLPNAVKEVWLQLPLQFRAFYETFHDGWYYIASCSLGPWPVNNFFILNEREWGILEEIGDPGCDLEKLLAVYTNGMGAFVALNCDKTSQYGDVIFWKDRRPNLNIDAWGVIDAWTELGFTT